MLHKYYAKIMKNVKLPQENRKENSASPLIRLPLFPKNAKNERVSIRPYSSPRNLFKNSPNNRSPLNFTSCLKRSHDENILSAQQKVVEEISIGLFSIYESLYRDLYADEVFFS